MSVRRLCLPVSRFECGIDGGKERATEWPSGRRLLLPVNHSRSCIFHGHQMHLASDKAGKPARLDSRAAAHNLERKSKATAAPEKRASRLKSRTIFASNHREINRAAFAVRRGGSQIYVVYILHEAEEKRPNRQLITGESRNKQSSAELCGSASATIP